MKELKQVKKIIIHCSATGEGKNFDEKDIKKWHLERGFEDIGYHYVILLDGSLRKGRDLKWQGAHVEGQNHDSIGVCYIGGLNSKGEPKDTRTEPQKKALKMIVGTLLDSHSLKKENVYGHNEFNKNKACPCFDVGKEFRE